MVVAVESGEDDSGVMMSSGIGIKEIQDSQR